MIPHAGMVLVAGGDAPADVREAMGALRPGDRVSVTLGLRRLQPEEAVGGHPVLVRDSAITAAARDTNAFAITRHPRTAVGVGDGGRRLLLLVVDGRQAPWSAGMTLLELATLMQSLGASEAINLDGGGSTAMVVRDPDGGVLEVVNRPSDPGGERAVGNALAIVRRC
jgi:exopolysaccharide biosynthesis protein